MRSETAFVGDVHGNLRALRGLVDALSGRDACPLVFLGDYINKGPMSAKVIDELVALAAAGRATLLAGNHEEALLDALDSEDLATFLKMGGAMTVRSYVGPRVGPDVLAEFRSALPKEHLHALRSMPTSWESKNVIASHTGQIPPTKKFRISGHKFVGTLPRIGQHSAHLDTGCGTETGRLTALLWPSLEYIQVDSQGRLVADL